MWKRKSNRKWKFQMEIPKKKKKKEIIPTNGRKPGG